MVNPYEQPSDRKVDHGAGMPAWNEATKQAGVGSVFSDRSRRERAMALKNLDLPRQKVCMVSADKFLEQPESYFEQVGSDHFFVYLQPPEEGNDLPIRDKDLSRDEAIQFVRDNLYDKQLNEWEVNIAEYYPNLYGGHIIVQSDGSVRAEFHPGNEGAISAGSVVPQYRISKSAHKNVFSYSFDDEALRTVFYKTIKDIPHDDGEFRPGYYEVQLVSKKPDGPIESMFIDYDPDPRARGEKGK